MNALALIQLVIGLLQGVLVHVKGTKVEQAVAADVQAALSKLQSVIGSDVTYGQLEGLKITNVKF